MSKTLIKSEKIVEICGSFSEISKQQLLKLFTSISGQKDLVLHPDIIPPLERICDAKWIKSNNIAKIYKIDPQTPRAQYTSPTVLYLTYPCKITLKRIIDEIQLDSNNSAGKYHIVHIPLTPHDVEDLLEFHGIHEYASLHSLQWLPIQLDSGLLTLEVPHVFRDLFVERDLTYLPCFSQAIWQVCQVFGKPDVWVEIGEHACAVRAQIEANLRSCGTTLLTQPAAIQAVIIMDRSADYASALLLPSTYAALLAEVYRPKCGVAEHKTDSTINTDESDIDERTYVPSPRRFWSNVKLYMDGEKDSIYELLKYRPFPEAMADLVRLLKQAATSSNSFQNSAAAGRLSVADMKSFVASSLKRTELAKRHDRAAEAIIRTYGDKFERRTAAQEEIVNGAERHDELIQEVLASSLEPYEAVRLFCLASVTRGYQKDSTKVRGFLNCFFTQHGYIHLPLQSRLIKAELLLDAQGNDGKRNLFSKSSTAARWKQVSSSTLPDSGDSSGSKLAANSPSYVFGGSYSPLVAQVVAAVSAGARVTELQERLKVFAHSNMDAAAHAYPLRERTFIVVIIGGVTYSELAALKLLEQITGSTIVVLSDKVITGNDIVDALLDSTI